MNRLRFTCRIALSHAAGPGADTARQGRRGRRHPSEPRADRSGCAGAEAFASDRRARRVLRYTGEGVARRTASRTVFITPSPWPGPTTHPVVVTSSSALCRPSLGRAPGRRGGHAAGDSAGRCRASEAGPAAARRRGGGRRLVKEGCEQPESTESHLMTPHLTVACQTAQSSAQGSLHPLLLSFSSQTLHTCHRFPFAAALDVRIRHWPNCKCSLPTPSR